MQELMGTLGIGIGIGPRLGLRLLEQRNTTEEAPVIHSLEYDPLNPLGALQF
jgi:hypothetical protein